METTLNKIKENTPCEPGWEKLLKFLNKTEADDEPLLIKTILESNGVKDAIWALRAVDGKDKEIRLMAADFTESVLHIFEKEYQNDDRPRKAIQASRDYAYGLISMDELNAAMESAMAAKGARWAASAAIDAVAAWNVARAANAAWAAMAASDTALATRVAARAAAMAAELKKQEEILLKYL